MIDYIAYQDTDSDFVLINDWLLNFLPEDKRDNWLNMPDKEKIDYILKIARIIEKDVNYRSYHETQKLDYNSQVDEAVFKIKFKQEVVIKTGIFTKKKKYVYHSIFEEGAETDEIIFKGLEIIRSDSPIIIKDKMKELATNIIRGLSDDEIVKKIEEYRELFLKCKPEDISENKSINNIKKYIVKDSLMKKTPYTLKGYLAYKKICHSLNISHKYEDISEGQKAKVVYVKSNRFNQDVISYPDVWPEEFNEYMQIDYGKMIENHFNKKLLLILEPLNKVYLLSKKQEEFISQFFE